MVRSQRIIATYMQKETLLGIMNNENGREP